MFADLPNRMTKQEVADATGKGLRTIDRYIAEGRLRAFRMGNRVFVAKVDLIDMLEPYRAAR